MQKKKKKKTKKKKKKNACAVRCVRLLRRVPSCVKKKLLVFT